MVNFDIKMSGKNPKFTELYSKELAEWKSNPFRPSQRHTFVRSTLKERKMPPSREETVNQWPKDISMYFEKMLSFHPYFWQFGFCLIIYLKCLGYESTIVILTIIFNRSCTGLLN